MSWLKKVLLKVFRSALEQIVQEAMEKTIKELNTEIDEVFKDEQERRILKSGIVMLRSRLLVVIRERL